MEGQGLLRNGVNNIEEGGMHMWCWVFQGYVGQERAVRHEEVCMISVHKTHSPCLITRKDTIVVVQFRFGEENTANLREPWWLFCPHGVGCWLGSTWEQREGVLGGVDAARVWQHLEGSGEEEKRGERIPFFSSSVWVDIITKTQFCITERKQEFEAEKGERECAVSEFESFEEHLNRDI